MSNARGRTLMVARFLLVRSKPHVFLLGRAVRNVVRLLDYLCKVLFLW